MFVPALGLVDPDNICLTTPSVPDWERWPDLNVCCIGTLLPRELFLAHGCIAVDADSILAALCRGESVAIIPGGVLEMGVPVKARARVPGIIKIAFEYDIPLRAVHFGGEELLCWIWLGEWRWITVIRRFFFRHIGYPYPTAWWVRNWLRHRPKLVTQVSAPMLKKDYPTVEDWAGAVDAYMLRPAPVPSPHT